MILGKIYDILEGINFDKIIDYKLFICICLYQKDVITDIISRK